MPALKWVSPLHTFSSGNLTFTATKECYLYGCVRAEITSNTRVKINNTMILNASIVGNGSGSALSTIMVPCTTLKSGDTVTVDAVCDNLHVFEEA